MAGLWTACGQAAAGRWTGAWLPPQLAAVPHSAYAAVVERDEYLPTLGSCTPTCTGRAPRSCQVRTGKDRKGQVVLLVTLVNIRWHGRLSNQSISMLQQHKYQGPAGLRPHVRGLKALLTCTVHADWRSQRPAFSTHGTRGKHGIPGTPLTKCSVVFYSL